MITKLAETLMIFPWPRLDGVSSMWLWTSSSCTGYLSVSPWRALKSAWQRYLGVGSKPGRWEHPKIFTEESNVSNSINHPINEPILGPFYIPNFGLLNLSRFHKPQSWGCSKSSRSQEPRLSEEEECFGSRFQPWRLQGIGLPWVYHRFTS